MVMNTGIEQEGIRPRDMMPANLAIKQDLQSTNRKEGPTTFDKWVLSKWQTIKQADMVNERQRHDQQFIAQQFYQSRQYGFWQGDTYINPDANKDNVYYQCDYFSEQVQALVTQFCAADIQLIVTPSENSSKGQAAARAASCMVGFHQRKMATPVNEQMTALRAILQGGYLFYTFFDPNEKSSGKYKIPKYSQTTVPNPDQMYNCLECGQIGMASELGGIQNAIHEQAESEVEELLEANIAGGNGELSPLSQTPQNCPSCGAMAQLVGPPEITTVGIEGYEEGNKGEIVSILVDGFEVGLHPAARACDPSTSPWLYYNFRMSKGQLKQVFPNYKGNSGIAPIGLQRQRQLEQNLGSFGSSYTVGGSWGRSSVDQDMVVVTMVWMRPHTYCSFTYEKDEPLYNGSVIPAGSKASDLFPDGLLTILVDGEVLDMRNEDMDDHWCGGPYRPVPNANWGLGIWSAIWQQRLINDAYNFYIEALKHNCSTQRLYNASVMDGNTIGSNPNSLTPIDLGPDTDLSKLMYFVPGPQIPSSVINFMDRARSDMRAQTGAQSALTGQAAANVSATDARQSKDAATATASLPTKIKAQVYARRMEQVLNLCKKHYVFTRTFPSYGSSDYSKLEIQQFAGSDINVDIFITFAEHSAIPTYKSDKTNDFMNAFQAGAWNKQLEPNVRRRICEVFNQPFSADKEGSQYRKAEIRFGAIERALQGFYALLDRDPSKIVLLEPEITIQPDPTTGIPVPVPGQKRIITEILKTTETQISIWADDHQTMMEWCNDWANSDRGIFCDPLLYEIISARFYEHQDAMMQVSQAASARAALATAPQMQAAGSQAQELGGAALPQGSVQAQTGSLTPEMA